MTARAAIRLQGPPAPRHRSDLVGLLRAAMAPPVILGALRRDWPYARRRGLDVVACHVLRVVPRGAKGFVLDYEVVLRGPDGTRRQPVIGELVGDGAEQWRLRALRKLRSAKRRQLGPGASDDALASLAQLGLVIRAPGLDERLVGLRLLHDPQAAAVMLAQCVPAAAGRAQPVSSAVLGHRLGKRCVVRLAYAAGAGGARNGSLIAKAYKMRSARGQQVFDAMARLATGRFGEGTGARVPRPIAYLPGCRTLLMEDLGGRLLHDLEGAERLRATAAAGLGLAELHRCAPATPARHGVDDEIGLLAGWVALAGEVHPDLRQGMTAALARVSAELERRRWFRAAPIHRDFYDKQVLVDGARTVLIDFDTLCLGDPALDVGNFLAHQRLAELQGRGRARPVAKAFLAAYGAAQSPDFSDRVESYARATLLRLACLYSLRSRWTHVVKPLLDTVHERGRLFP